MQEETNDTEGTIDTRKYESWFTFQAGTLKRGTERKIERGRERESAADVFSAECTFRMFRTFFSFKLLSISFKFFQTGFQSRRFLDVHQASSPVAIPDLKPDEA